MREMPPTECQITVDDAVAYQANIPLAGPSSWLGVVLDTSMSFVAFYPILLRLLHDSQLPLLAVAQEIHSELVELLIGHTGIENIAQYVNSEVWLTVPAYIPAIPSAAVCMPMLTRLCALSRIPRKLNVSQLFRSQLRSGGRRGRKKERHTFDLWITQLYRVFPRDVYDRRLFYS